MTSLLSLEQQYLALHPKPYAVPLGKLAPILEACTLAMSKRDWIVTGPRGRVVAMLRGCSAERLASSGDGLHSYKISPSSLNPANRALHAVGLALSSQRPVLCFLGQASTANGAYYEALNIAALKNTPVLFVVLAQDLSDVPMSPQTSSTAHQLASAMTLHSEMLTAEPETVRSAVDRFRTDPKPTLLEIQLEK